MRPETIRIARCYKCGSTPRSGVTSGICPGRRRASIIAIEIDEESIPTMRPPLSSLCAAVVALSLFSFPAVGQSIPSAFEYLERRQEIGPVAGIMSADGGRFGFGPSGGPVFGLRYAIELTGPVALEGLGGVVDGTRDVVDPSRLPGDRIIGEVDSRQLLVDAGFRFTFTGRRSWHELAPFIAAGAGIAIDLLDTSVVDERLLPADVFDFGNSFFGTLGLGTRWFVTESIAARVEGTFSLWKLDTPTGFDTPERGFENVSDSEWVAGNAVAITLLYRW
jgi:hypothetical protein